MHNVLRFTTFDDATVRNETSGCGILPVARRPSDGKVCFLLAKEHHVPSWRGSMRWSAFEGGRHADESIEEAAMREWCEESMNVVHGVDAPTLLRDDYVCKLTLKVVQTKRVTTHCTQSRYHIMYAVEVPYDESVVERFARTRQVALRAHALIKTMTTTRVVVNDPAVTRVALTDDKRLTVRFNDGRADAVLDIHGPMRIWVDAASELTAMSDHQTWGVQVQRGEGCNALVHAAFCNTDYLEKQEVRWWDLDELHTVMANGGRMGDEQFRVYFMPMLEGMLDFFARTMSTPRCARAASQRLSTATVSRWDGTSIIGRLF